MRKEKSGYRNRDLIIEDEFDKTLKMEHLSTDSSPAYYPTIFQVKAANIETAVDIASCFPVDKAPSGCKPAFYENVGDTTAILKDGLLIDRESKVAAFVLTRSRYFGSGHFTEAIFCLKPGTEENIWLVECERIIWVGDIRQHVRLLLDKLENGTLSYRIKALTANECLLKKII